MMQGGRAIPISFLDTYLIFMSQMFLAVNKAVGRVRKQFYIRLSRYHGISVSLKNLN